MIISLKWGKFVIYSVIIEGEISNLFYVFLKGHMETKTPWVIIQSMTEKQFLKAYSMLVSRMIIEKI